MRKHFQQTINSYLTFFIFRLSLLWLRILKRLHYNFVYSSSGSKNFERGVEEKGGGRQFISFRPHLSQMHTTNYMPYIHGKRRLFEQKL